MYFVECKPDFRIIKKIFSLTKREIRHGKNKPGVLELLDKTTGSIGIIDEDPERTQPRLLDSYELVVETNLNFSIFKNTPKNNYLIVLKPYFEEWILEVSGDSKINLKRFNLPTNAKDLHRVINTKLDNLERLLDEILVKNSKYFNELVKKLEILQR